MNFVESATPIPLHLLPFDASSTTNADGVTLIFSRVPLDELRQAVDEAAVKAAVRAQSNAAPGGVVRAADYGAVGDGVTDDAVALQAAINDAHERSAVLEFDARVYVVGRELTNKGTHFALRGTPYAGRGRTILRAAAGSDLRSILRLQGVGNSIRDIVFDGNRTAEHALYLAGCSQSIFENVGVVGATSDGIHNANKQVDGVSHAINDTNVWRDLTTSGCGTLRVSSSLADADAGLYGFFRSSKVLVTFDGSCSMTAGSQRVTLDVDVSAWGLRAGDPVRMGLDANKRFGMIERIVGASELLVAFDTPSGRCDITVDRQGFAIGRGDGYHEQRSGDNNIHAFEGRQLHRGHAGYGLAFDGLYGPRVSGSMQVDFLPSWGIRVGTHGNSPVITSVFNGVYFEGLGTKVPFLLRSAQDIAVIYPLDYGSDAAGSVSYCGSASSCRGVYLNTNGLDIVGGPTAVQSHIPSVTIGKPHLRGARWFGPLKLETGQSSVVNGVATRSNSSTAGSPIMTIQTNGSDDVEVRDIATNADGRPELLFVKAAGGGTVSLVQGPRLRLRTERVTLSEADGVLPLVYVLGYWQQLATA